MQKEKDRLEHVALNSTYTENVNSSMILYCYNIVKRELSLNKTLELGPAEGVMTNFLVNDSKELTVVEGSKVFSDNLKQKYASIKVYNSLFEDFKTDEKFDSIILGHVLEHVENPVEILNLVKNWLTPDGLVFAAVPNSNSIHRQVAVLMGLLEKENSMSELDLHHGHRRVYNYKEFQEDFTKAGLNIIKTGGYWFKPVSNAQIAQSWSKEMLDAFMVLGEKYPETAAETYVIAGGN